MFGVTADARAHACMERSLGLRKKLFVIGVASNAVRSSDADVGRVARGAIVAEKGVGLGERSGTDELLPTGSRACTPSMDEQWE